MDLDEKRFDSAVGFICGEIACVLQKLSVLVKENTQEIRLRRGKAVTLTQNEENFYLLKNGNLTNKVNKDCVFVTKEDIEKTFKLLVRSSVYSHLEEIKEGFVIMPYGHRAGICGTLLQNGGMGNISSVNIRIARQIIGCAKEIAKAYSGGGLLIAGPPGSGKTTLLRDFIRITANEKRVCVVDTRGELSASCMGECFNDLGQNADVLVGYPKDKGLFMALRTMFPQMIAFDEFSTLSELNEISQGFLSGVDVALTAHIGNEDQLIKRELTKKLINSGAIKTVILLSGFKNREIIIKDADELVKKCGS